MISMQKFFDFYVSAFVIGAMVFYFPNEEFYRAQELWFQYGALGLLGLSFIVPKRRDIESLYLGILFIYLIVNTLVFNYTNSARYELINVALGMVAIKVIAERVTLNFNRLGKTLAVFCLINVIQLMLQVLNIDPIYTNIHLDKMAHVDHTGFLGSRFALGSVATMALPFIFNVSPLACLITVPMLIFGKSSICVFASAVCFLAMMWKSDRKWFWIMLSVILASALVFILKYDMPSGEFSKRFYVWGSGLAIVRGKPLFGLGLGAWASTGFTSIQRNGQPETWLWAHNEYLQFLFEAGITGVIILWLYVKDLYRNTISHTAGVAFAGLLMISFLHFPFQIARLACMAIYIIATMEATRA